MLPSRSSAHRLGPFDHFLCKIFHSYKPVYIRVCSKFIVNIGHHVNKWVLVKNHWPSRIKPTAFRPLQGSWKSSEVNQLSIMEDEQESCYATKSVRINKGIVEDTHTHSFYPLKPRNLKGGIRSLFDPFVNAMGPGPWPSRMEVSYCTFGFGAIIQGDLRTLSLPCDSPRSNLYACVI